MTTPNIISRLRQHIRTTVTILTVILSVSVVNAASPIEIADSAYNAHNFRQALSLYNLALDQQGSSSELYYNIGNTHYRLGNIGQAVVAYERALRLDPSNDDARANLDFVNSTIKGMPEDGSTFLSNIHSGIISLAGPDGWAITALVLFIVVLGCIVLYLFTTNVTLRKIGFFGGFVILCLFIYAAVIAWQTANAINDHDTAVVISSNAKLRTNPGAAKTPDSKTINIPEGTCVQIIDSMATPSDPVSPMYYNIRLNGTTEAWIGSSYLERI